MTARRELETCDRVGHTGSERIVPPAAPGNGGGRSCPAVPSRRPS